LRPSRGLASGKTHKRPKFKGGKGQVKSNGSCLRSANGLISVQRNGVKIVVEG